MKRIDLAYMAGLFDGEGSIVIHARKYVTKQGKIQTHSYAELCLGSTDEWVVRFFQVSFGGNVYLRRPAKPGARFGTSSMWAWQVAARKTIPPLEALLPYLRLKRAQAEIALRFQRRTAQRVAKHSHQLLLTEEELAVREADKFLISALNHRKKGPQK